MFKNQVTVLHFKFRIKIDTFFRKNGNINKKYKEIYLNPIEFLSEYLFEKSFDL